MIWLSVALGGAVGACLREAGEAAAAAAESDAEADRRKKTLGDALAAVSLHVAMASEAGEFTMRDVVLEAAREVRKRTSGFRKVKQKKLELKGLKFKSQTDKEVITLLITEAIKNNKTL